jgi:hypothetical protein
VAIDQCPPIRTPALNAILKTPPILAPADMQERGGLQLQLMLARKSK